MYSDFEEIPDENVVIESPRQLHSFKNDIALTQNDTTKKPTSNDNDKEFLNKHKKLIKLNNEDNKTSSLMDVITDSLPKNITDYNQRFNCNKNTNINIYILPKNDENIINNYILKIEKNRKSALSKIINDSSKKKGILGIRKKISLRKSKSKERMDKSKAFNDANNFLLKTTLNLESEDLFKNSVLIQEGQKYRMINSIKHSKSKKTKGRLDDFSSSSSSKYTKTDKLKMNNISQNNYSSKKLDINKARISRNIYNNSLVKGNSKNTLQSFNSYYPYYKNISFENLLKTEISKDHFEKSKTFKNSVATSPHKNKKQTKYNNNFITKINYEHSKKYNKFLNKKNHTINSYSHKKISRNIYNQEILKEQKSNNMSNREVIKENDEFLKMQKVITLTVIDPSQKQKNKPKKKKYGIINNVSNKSSTNANTTNSNTNRSSINRPIDHKNDYNNLTFGLSNKEKNCKYKISKNLICISSIINKIKTPNLRKNSPDINKVVFNTNCIYKNNSKDSKKPDLFRIANTEIKNGKFNKIKLNKILEKK